MQAVYYLASDVVIESEGQLMNLTSYHDEYSLWFSLDPENQSTTVVPRPFCNCSVHLAVSPTRLGQLNDATRNGKFLQALRPLVNPETICLVSGDCSLLALMVGQLGARKVYAVEDNRHWRRVLQTMIDINELDDRVVLIDSRNIVEENSILFKVLFTWLDLYFVFRH